MEVPLLILVAVVAVFLLSGVVPAYLRARARTARVRAFGDRYAAAVKTPPYDREPRTLGWLVARRSEMQADAEAAGRGLRLVGPPPLIGGRWAPHAMFTDLFSEQTNSEMVTESVRLRELATTVHDCEEQEGARRAELFNPAAWFRRAFERLVGFPRYLLRVAGFSESTVDGPVARVLTLIWGAALGASTIVAAVVAVLGYLRDG